MRSRPKTGQGTPEKRIHHQITGPLATWPGSGGGTIYYFWLHEINYAMLPIGAYCALVVAIPASPSITGRRAPGAIAFANSAASSMLL